jgi:glycerate-2-kinase
LEERAIETARGHVLAMFTAAVQEVDPARAVASHLAFEQGTLTVAEVSLDVSGGVHLIAIGKAAGAMAQGALAVLNGAIVSGDVITKEGHVSATCRRASASTRPATPSPTSEGCVPRERRWTR